MTRRRAARSCALAAHRRSRSGTADLAGAAETTKNRLERMVPYSAATGGVLGDFLRWGGCTTLPSTGQSLTAGSVICWSLEKAPLCCGAFSTPLIRLGSLL